MTAKTVHIDKLKAYLGTPPRSWLPATTGESNTTVDSRASTSPLLPGTLIGPILPPSTGQQTVPRPVNQQRDYAGKQRDLVSVRPSSALPPPVERDVESERYIPDNSSVQWDADLIPVREECSTPSASSIQWETVRIPAKIVESGGSKLDNSGAQWRPVLTPIREETGETGDSSVQWNADLTPVEEGVIADVPVVDHATTPATVLQSGGESEKCHVPGKSWNRSRAHSSAAWQRGNKGRKPSGTVTANIHPVYDNNNPDTVISYSQMPPRNGVPLGSLQDQPAHIDFSLTPSPERPSFEPNPLAVEFVPASTDRDRQREEVYSADWSVGENRPRRNRKLPNKFANFYMGKGNVCRSSCAAQAKDYGYLLNNGNSKGKVKGFKVTGETEEKMTNEQRIKLIKGAIDPIDVNYNQFKIENCKIFTKNMIKQWAFKFDKRMIRKIGEDDIDTLPYGY